MTNENSLKDLRRQGFIKLENIQAQPDLRSLEADLILLHALKIEGAGREYLISKSLDVVSVDVISIYFDLLERRSTGEPLAYILNKKEFYGRDFYVDKRVLIPRPDTEILVEKALTKIVKQNVPTNIVDIGTGSGCILVSMISELIERGHSTLLNQSIATDMSEEALRLAKINSARLLPLDHAPKFLKSDLLSSEVVGRIDNKCPLVILANLPYIDELDPETCDQVRHFEPNEALFSRNEGLEHIFKLLAQVSDLSNFLEFKENKISLFLEIGYKQANRVEFEANKIGFRSVIVHVDLSGKDRIIECII